jgi:hypothetical protein
MLHATEKGFDALVFVTDADRQHERIPEFDQAQESTRFSISRALGIAVEAFDAWILADNSALSQVLEQAVSMQPLPEVQRPGRARGTTRSWNRPSRCNRYLRTSREEKAHRGIPRRCVAH